MSCLGGFGKWICVFLGNISLCFLWDFDYFVETYLEVVNLLIKMRILLSVICCNDDDLKYFLLYGFVCVIFSLMSLNVLVGIGVLMGVFGKSIGVVVVISLGLCKMCLIQFWLIWGCVLCEILMILLNLS